METMETSQHEECAAVNAGTQSQAELSVSMMIFECLQAKEGQAQRDGQEQANNQLLAIVLQQPPMRPSDRSARTQQQQCINGRNTPSGHWCKHRFGKVMA